MTSNKLVLFDIDGTLVRGAGPHHKQALIAAAKEVMGIDCTLDNIDTAGKLDPDLLVTMVTNAGFTKSRADTKLSLMLEAAQHHYSVHCKADFSDKLCPGVKSTLEMLVSKGIPLGLVTGNLSAIAWRKLENAKIDHHFRVGAFAEEARSRARLAKLAVFKARRKDIATGRCSVALVGDHANDIQAARENGYRSVAVATGVMSFAELKALNPDVVLESLEGASIETITG